MRSAPRTVIEISSTHLKVVKVARIAGHMKVCLCEVRDIMGASDDEIVSRLKDISRKGNLARGTSVTGVIPRQEAIVRFLNLPSFDPKEIRKMVALQAFQQVPYTAAEAVMDHMIVSQPAMGYSKVMAVIVPKDIFLRYWRICERAGLAPARMTMSSEGLCAPFEATGHVNAVLDIDAAGGEVCICDGGKLLTSRPVRMDAGAENAGKVADIIRQVELTFSGYEKELVGALVVKTSVLSAGGYADLLAQEGRRVLSRPFEVEHPLEKIQTAKGFAWPQEVVEGKVSVMAVCGLAFMDHDPSIDLVDLQVREAQQQRELVHRALRACVLLLTALVFLAWAGTLPLFRKSAVVDSLEQEFARMKSSIARVQAKADKIEIFEKIISKRVLLADMIRELYGLIPADTVLVSLDISSDKRLSLQGYSADRNVVEALQKSMAKGSVFDDVKLENVSKRVIKVGEVNFFEITCRIAGEDEISN